jgi:hypothetical protein
MPGIYNKQEKRPQSAQSTVAAVCADKSELVAAKMSSALSKEVWDRNQLQIGEPIAWMDDISECSLQVCAHRVGFYIVECVGASKLALHTSGTARRTIPGERNLPAG